MQPAESAAARQAILDELRHAALETYGEERAAEEMIERMLNASATALWRVSEEPLEPMDHEPLPTHG